MQAQALVTLTQGNIDVSRQSGVLLVNLVSNSCVSGCLLCVKTAYLGKEIFTTESINNSVIFLRKGDIILTNDAWHVTAELSVRFYEEAISTIRDDLRLMHEQRKEFTSIAELKQIEVLLGTLESTLRSFYSSCPGQTADAV